MSQGDWRKRLNRSWRAVSGCCCLLLLHPPTAYRIAFLETLGPLPGAMALSPERHARLTAEWAPHLDMIGGEVLARRSVEAA